MQVNSMSYDEFKDHVKDNILDFLPEKYSGYSVEIAAVIKNNGLKLDGLLVRPVDVPAGGSVATPNIYLNDIYKNAVDRDQSIDEVMSQLANTYTTHTGLQLDLSQITEYDKAVEMLVPRLINAEMNNEYLADKPHTFIDDLAVMYEIRLNNEMSVPVTEDLMNRWNVSIDTLHDVAVKNLDATRKPSFRGITGVLIDIGVDKIGEDMMEQLKNSPDFMYVLSNEDMGTYGSAQILNDNIMEKVCDMFPQGFYIIPSSVHEVLVVPESEIEVSALSQMIREVNATQLAPDEILSDHAYQYDRATHTLHTAQEHDESQSQEQNQSHKRARAMEMDMTH